eukprot:374742-Rhodomonas_salina.1
MVLRARYAERGSEGGYGGTGGQVAAGWRERTIKEGETLFDDRAVVPSSPTSYLFAPTCLASPMDLPAVLIPLHLLCPTYLPTSIMSACLLLCLVGR